MKRRINTVPFAGQMEDSFGWLPAGWIIEIKTRKGGTSAGSLYKCYIAPKTGCKFYSKQEVFRYLKTGKLDHETPQPKRRTLNALSADNVVSRIEKSPDGLPPGWTKEIKFRKKRLGHGIRRDPYYTDPVTGCVFRSKSDVIHYLETGNLGTRVSKPKKMCIDAMNSTVNKPSSPVTVKRQKLSGNSARRCLFESRRMNINGATAEQISGSTLKEQRGEDVDSSSLGCTRKHSKTRQGKRVQVKKRSYVSENKKLSKSRDNKPLVNGVMLESEEKQHLQVFEADKQLSQNVALPELEDKKQENGDPESSNKTVLWNGEPLESGDNNKQTEGEVLSKSQEGKLSENLVLMESEGTKRQLENQASETDEQLLQNAVLSELEDKKQEKEVLMELRNGMLSGNQVTLELGDNKQTLSGVLMESEDTKQQLESQALETDEQLLQNAVLSELEDKKREEVLMELRNKMLSGNQVTLESGDNKQTQSGVLLESHDGKPSENRVLKESEVINPWGNGVPLGSEAKLLLEENQMEGKRKTRRARLHSSKVKDEKATLLPRRASKRLAGLEAEVVLDITSPERAHRVATKRLAPDLAVESTQSGCDDYVSEQLNPQVDPTPCMSEETKEQPEKPLIEKTLADEKPESPFVLPFGDSRPDPCLEFAFKTLTGCGDRVSEQLNLQVDSAPWMSEETKEQLEKPLIDKLPADEKSESPFALPFGDSWPDPCLEFAFKTLTGDIPEAMDTTGIEDFFQQQLGVGQTQSLGSDVGLLQSELHFQPGKDMPGQREQGMPEVKESATRGRDL